jgi:two-component system, NarL family, sensor kinase
MAGASTVWVTLRQDGDRITLTVRDEGVGFDPAVLDRCIADGHIGLASLAARVEAMGGSVDITSVAGRVTRATVTAPFERDCRR